jgi:hypothetical protein
MGRWLTKTQPKYNQNTTFMKPRIGRPKLPKGVTKNVLIGARFDANDAKAVLTAIKRSKLGKSAWIRKALLASAAKQR